MKKILTILTCTTIICGLSLFLTCYPISAAQGDTIELNYAMDAPPFPPSVKIAKDWADAIAKRTNGKIKINFYWGGSLAKGKDMRRSVLKGVVDIGALTLSHDLSAFPMNSVIMLPVLGIPDRDVGTRIWGDLIEKFPELRDEFKGMKVLGFRVDLPHMVHGVKKPIKIPADIKRLKIASFGIGAKILETMGASPVMLMPGDVYMGLERGVAEGGYSTYFTAQMLRILDLLPYHNTTILNWFGNTLLMNLKKWNNLSADIQRVFDEESAKLFVNQSNLSKEYEEKARLIAVKKGHTFIDNTPEEVELWHEAVRPYQEIWIKENEAKGLPARTVYEETRKLVTKYSK